MKRDKSGEAREVRRVATRAIWRLNLLEYVILALAAGLALLAGAVAAFLLGAALDLPFRPTWAVASLVLFAIPAAAAYLRERRSARMEREKKTAPRAPDGARRDRDH